MFKLSTFRIPGLILCYGAFCLFHASSAISAPPGWNKVWSDEFEGSSLDTSKWEAIDWTTPHNKEMQAYHPSQVSVSDGNLQLTAIDEEYGGKPYTSGKVESKWTKRHGRWEIRAKLPGTQGTWPAIWLLPDTKKYHWPSQGEIDIMENRGNQPYITSSAFHYGPRHNERKFVTSEQRTTNLGVPENYHQQFHTYSVEWDEKSLRFFVDDVNYYTVYDSELDGFLSNQTAPVEVQLNVAVGGIFVKNAPPGPESSWPQQMLVDYVRVYERDENPPPMVFVNGGFEAEGGSLKHWTTFGKNTEASPNIQVHQQAVSDGKAALKLAGPSSEEHRESGIEQAITVSPGDSISAGAKAYVSSDNPLAGTENRTEMRIDYYREAGGKFDSPAYISSESITIADAETPSGKWHSHSLSDRAPAEAVEARLVLVFVQPKNEGGAVYLDEISFDNLDVEFDADANRDGRVDGLDLLEWQKGVGNNDGTSVAEGDFNYDGVVDKADRAVWESQYGQSDATAVGESSQSDLAQ